MGAINGYSRLQTAPGLFDNLSYQGVTPHERCSNRPLHISGLNPVGWARGDWGDHQPSHPSGAVLQKLRWVPIDTRRSWIRLWLLEGQTRQRSACMLQAPR